VSFYIGHCLGHSFHHRLWLLLLSKGVMPLHLIAMLLPLFYDTMLALLPIAVFIVALLPVDYCLSLLYFVIVIPAIIRVVAIMLSLYLLEVQYYYLYNGVMEKGMAHSHPMH